MFKILHKQNPLKPFRDPADCDTKLIFLSMFFRSPHNYYNNNNASCCCSFVMMNNLHHIETFTNQCFTVSYLVDIALIFLNQTTAGSEILQSHLLKLWQKLSVTSNSEALLAILDHSKSITHSIIPELFTNLALLMPYEMILPHIV